MGEKHLGIRQVGDPFIQVPSTRQLWALKEARFYVTCMRFFLSVCTHVHSVHAVPSEDDLESSNWSYGGSQCVSP